MMDHGAIVPSHIDVSSSSLVVRTAQSPVTSSACYAYMGPNCLTYSTKTIPYACRPRSAVPSFHFGRHGPILYHGRDFHMLLLHDWSEVSRL